MEANQAAIDRNTDLDPDAGGESWGEPLLDQSTIDQMAVAFVTHATVLIATNLVAEVEPSLLGFLPERVPEADALIEDSVLLDQAIRAPRGQPRVERALHWFDTVWFALPERELVKTAVAAEIERQREHPLIADLDDAMGEAADLLEVLTRQTEHFRDTASLWEVVEGVRRWQVDPTRAALIELERLCHIVDDPADLPSTEIVHRIRFFAREGSLTASDYLALHFKPAELMGWDTAELTDVVRMRYPLLRRADVARLVGEARGTPAAAE